MSRIAETFQTLGSRNEKALIAYLMGGDPDAARTLGYFEALAHGGADLIEIGVPYSDPVADGPVIQAAATRALKAGATPETVFELVRQLRARTAVPLVLMTYYNPVFVYGEGAFVADCRAAGVDGLIVPDLPVEEAGALNQLTEEAGVDLVFLATPETPPERVGLLAEAGRGFLYLVSRHGVTGAHASLAGSTAGLVRHARQVAHGRPLAVGFGLFAPDHVRAALQAGADAAVVGSALVQEVARGTLPQLLQDRVRLFKAATRPGQRTGNAPH